MHYHPLHLYRYQVCKQADTVLAHYLFPDYQDKETEENSFRYYEKITTHDSSLSTCVFSIMAVSYTHLPKCADSNIRLSQLYHDAISLAVRLICEYRENGAADSEYQHTFGVE